MAAQANLDRATNRLAVAERQLSEAEKAYAIIQRERDAAAHAVRRIAADIRQALSEGASAVSRCDALLVESVTLALDQISLEIKLQACAAEVNRALSAIQDIEAEHRKVHYVSKMADQALQVMLHELVESAAVSLRQGNAFAEPYNSRRKQRLTISDR